MPIVIVKGEGDMKKVSRAVRVPSALRKWIEDRGLGYTQAIKLVMSLELEQGDIDYIGDGYLITFKVSEAEIEDLMRESIRMRIPYSTIIRRKLLKWHIMECEKNGETDIITRNN